MRYYDTCPSPHGTMLLVATDDALIGAWFEGQKHHPGIAPDWRRDPDHRIVCQAKRELAEYFAGARRRFDLPLAPQGTAFQRAVWNAIAEVAYGATLSYKALAQRAGFADSIRAVGAATGRNPISIVVPCHRIVGSDGALHGYAGGLDTKRALLALEGARPHVPVEQPMLV